MSRNSPTWLYAISASIFYRACSRIVAVSSGVSNDIKGITLGLENKLTVIYNPIFPPAQLHDIETPGSRGRKIIWVGRLDDPKNPQLALEAFALVLQAEDLSLTIVGDGRLHSDLRKKSKELGIQDRIKFSGFLTDPYVEMLDSDLLILTSDREGLGNVIVEAMLCGLRVVSTDCGEGVHEVLQEGAYGTIVPVRDAAKMARAIEAELASPSSKEQQIEGARRFLPKSIARQFLTVMGNRVQMP